MEAEPNKVEPKRRRRWLQFSLRTLLIGVAIVAVSAAIISRLPNELTWQQLQTIKPGMTEDEVRELVGRPDAIRINDQGSVDWKYGSFWPDTVEFKSGRVVAAYRAINAALTPTPTRNHKRAWPARVPTAVASRIGTGSNSNASGVPPMMPATPYFPSHAATATRAVITNILASDQRIAAF